MQGLRAHGSRHVFSPSPQKSVTGNLPPVPHPLTPCSVTDTMDLLTPPEYGCFLPFSVSPWEQGGVAQESRTQPSPER